MFKKLRQLKSLIKVIYRQNKRINEFKREILSLEKIINTLEKENDDLCQWSLVREYVAQGIRYRELSDKLEELKRKTKNLPDCYFCDFEFWQYECKNCKKLYCYKCWNWDFCKECAKTPLT